MTCGARARPNPSPSLSPSSNPSPSPSPSPSSNRCERDKVKKKLQRDKVKAQLVASELAKKRNRIFSRRQTEQRKAAEAWLCSLNSMSRTSPERSASATQAADWPRLAEARAARSTTLRSKGAPESQLAEA